MTSPADLDALRALHARATPGEWRVPAANVHRVIAFVNGEPTTGIIEHPEESYFYGATQLSYYEMGPEAGGRQSKADRALIVALHNAFPALADRLEAAERVVAAAREYRERAWCYVGALVCGDPPVSGRNTIRDFTDAQAALDAALRDFDEGSERKGS